jgi:hypothetical protein
MDTLETNIEAKSLRDFCAGVMLRHKENWPPNESTLAREFADQFLPELFSNPERIVAFAARLGIDASLKALPDGLHGVNCLAEEETVIILNEQEGFPGSREHTFFHELREIMEHRFRDQGWATVQGPDLEKHAEQFAAQVRLTILTKDLGRLVDGLQNVEASWKRCLGFVGIFILFLALGAGCALLPHLEDNLPAAR